MALHVIVASTVLPRWLDRPVTDRLLELRCPMQCPDSEEPIVYEMTVLPEPVAEALPPPEPIPSEVTQAEEEPEEPQAPEEEADERTEPEPVPENAYMVDLAADEEVEPPPDTIYLAQDNNRTDEQMQAEVTTYVETQPGQEESASSEPLEDVPETDEHAEGERDEAEQERLVARAEPSPQVARLTPAHPTLPSDPNYPGEARPHLDLSAFNPSMHTYQDSILASQDLRQRERIARQFRHEGYLGTDDQAEWERTRATLENMVPEIRTGTETRLNTRRHEYAQYVAYMHRRIHALWGDGFLVRQDLRFDLSDPMNDPGLEAVLELIIDASGEIERVNIVSTSGLTMYDSEAVLVAYQIGPLRPPPAVMLSENGNAYVHWSFWRDQRQCGTFGASVHWLE